MVVQVRTAEYVTIDLFAAISGLTASAVRNMIHEGKWTEGRQYQRRAGRVYVSLKGYEKWVATGLV
ncbi:excisionase [Curvibacter sp. HBC28]|uniref:Excisionase n=2 Tax=Curvibacter microcysteis TaxID=3026419 RepID=A0ABT5MCF7_9BURK|nr:excisionase [Curvibacter sp. HBC28]MDD0814252.1 excisionase [Curvibacter sp. HBC28]